MTLTALPLAAVFAFLAFIAWAVCRTAAQADVRARRLARERSDLYARIDELPTKDSGQ